MVAFADAEIDVLLRDNPDAFLLLAILRRTKWGEGAIYIPAKMGAMISRKSWPLHRLFRDCARLLDLGKIVEAEKGRLKGFSKYRLAASCYEFLTLLTRTGDHSVITPPIWLGSPTGQSLGFDAGASLDEGR